MADKKPPAPSKKLDLVEEVGFLLLLLVIIAAILRRISAFIGSKDIVVDPNSITLYLQSSVFPVLKFLSFGVSIASLVGILYVLSKMSALVALQNEMFIPVVASHGAAEPTKNMRWEKVIEHVNSVNPNDWKFAILEADIILDELLTTMRYKGETMADKLKSVEKSDFNTIEEAWEGHKIRNAIAHEGTSYVITDREARRVIALYEKVFQEFHYI